MSCASGSASLAASDSDLSYFDREEAAFHERVRDGYLRLAAKDPLRFRLVDASGTIEQAREQVEAVISNLKFEV